MNTYRLLRSNKESGPYTADQLIVMGFKAYDLIWIEGKSAAWRYPSEVEEFKMFAPDVEEQPSDRFYARKTADILQYEITKEKFTKSEIKPQDNTTQYKATAIQPEIKGLMIEIRERKPEAGNVLFEVREKMLPSDNISNQENTVPTEKPRIKIKADIREIPSKLTHPDWQNPISSLTPVSTQNQKQLNGGPLNWQNAWLDWEKEKKGISVNSGISSNKKDTYNYKVPVVETKFSQSLEEIKEKYVETVLKQKKAGRTSTQPIAIKYLVPGTAVAIVLGFGFWMGSLEGKPGKPLANTTTTETPLQTQGSTRPDSISTYRADTESTYPEDITFSQADKTTLVYTLPQKNAAHKTSNAKEKKAANNFKYLSATEEKSTESLNKISDNNKDPNYTPPVTENKNIIVSKKEDKPVFPVTKTQTVNDFIKLGNSTISLNENVADNTLQVRNVSDIAFNLVVIDLQYYDANGRFRKGETFYLKNFNGGKSLNVKIPDDKASVKVTATVSMISSDIKNIYLIAE